jgi:hypothetical protein
LQELFFTKIDIDASFKKYTEACEEMRAICLSLKSFLFVSKSHAHHKVLIKTIIRVAIIGKNERHREAAKEYEDEICTEYGSTPGTIMSAYGWLQNYQYNKSLQFNAKVFHETFVKCSLKYSRNSKYFAMSIENYTQAYDFGLIAQNDPFTFTVIATNLEVGLQNVHKLLLELYRRVIRHADKSDHDDVLEVILDEMSWYNRNKHYLLSIMIAERPEMLYSCKHYHRGKFLSGLRIGLSQYHLYSSSTSLVKVIYNSSEFRTELMQLSADIILNGTDYETNNFFKLWFTALDEKFRCELFNIVINSYDFTKVCSTSIYLLRATSIRNAFDKALSPQMETCIQKYCCSIDDVKLKIEIYSLLLSDVYKPNELAITCANIFRLLEFIRRNMCTGDSVFIDSVIKQLPNLFNHFATNRFKDEKICREIFTVIKNELYEHGIAFGTYESSVFSLRLLEVILKQYCGTPKGKRLSKNTDMSINEKFRAYLRENDIWDVASSEIFHQLMKMANDIDNSDICTTASEMLLEYFIKTPNIDRVQFQHGESFLSWINRKVLETFNATDIEAYHENISYWALKYEYFSEGLMEIVNELQQRNDSLITCADPVNSMQQGHNLFVLLDCINYSIARMDGSEVAVMIIPAIMPLLRSITDQVLNFVNDGASCPSFDVLDKKLQGLVENSSWKSENITEMKRKLLLSFFFTLRALAEISKTITKIMNETTEPSETVYYTTLSTCVDINIQILSRFCHKGVVESASNVIGHITKIISTRFSQQSTRSSPTAMNLQRLLITLKHEIDCGKRHASKTGEIRSKRGSLQMAHNIIRGHSAFLKFLIKRVLVTKDVQTFYDTQDIQYAGDVQPIHLHLVACLLKDSSLVEEMVKYYDIILLATFKSYKESKDFIIQNALLQIIGNITPKIANHKRHAIDDTMLLHYEAKAISVYEFYVKLTYSFRVALFDLETNFSQLSQTYIIILLEIFSNFEHRKPQEFSSEMERVTMCFEKLIEHPNEKIRTLAARCYSQWHLPKDLPAVIKEKTKCMFSTDPNLAHGSVVAVRHMVDRYEASVKHIRDFDRDEFLREIRVICATSSHSKIAKSFYLRSFVLDFLLFLGFSFNDNLIEMILMDESNVDSKIGYSLWRQKINETKVSYLSLSYDLLLSKQKTCTGHLKTEEGCKSTQMGHEEYPSHLKNGRLGSPHENVK